MNARPRRAATSHVSRSAQVRSWSSHHSGCLHESLLRLLRTPLSSILTMAVLAIALALPGGLYVLHKTCSALANTGIPTPRSPCTSIETFQTNRQRHYLNSSQEIHALPTSSFLVATAPLKNFAAWPNFKTRSNI